MKFSRIPVLFRFVLSISLVVFALIFSPVSEVYAATITVNSNADIVADDGQCTLREAIAAANANTTSGIMPGECDAGSGPDDIILPAGTYMLSVDQSIIEDLTINGAGASNTIVDRGWTNEATTMRIFSINSGTTLYINNVTLQNGHAEADGVDPDDHGGGIFNNGGTLNINSSIIRDNRAGSGDTSANYGYGGGIYNNAGTLNINASTISGNYAGNRGGGIANEGAGIIIVTNSTFSDNQSTWGGGVNMLHPSSTANISNSTFSSNHATNGGGINNFQGQTTVINSTFYNNTATTSGGGLRNNDTLVINHNLISGNIAAAGAEIYQSGGTINADNYNVFGHSGLTDAQAYSGFSPGTNDYNATSNVAPSTGNNIPLSSILDTTLADNGGPTLTHALVTGSPAVDFVPNTEAACDPGTSTDQRGAVRADGVDRGGTDCDTGAYEFGSIETPTAIRLVSFNAKSNMPFFGIAFGVIAIGGLITLRRVKKHNR